MKKKGETGRLPRGTIKIDRRLKTGHYDPNTKKIHVKNLNKRRLYHEKAHYLWDNKLTPKQKKKFEKTIIKRIKETTGDKRRGIKTTSRTSRAESIEEIWAVSYAAYKMNQRLNPQLKAVVEEYEAKSRRAVL